MDLKRIDDKELSLILTEDQPRIIQGCLREIRVALHRNVLGTRVGASYEILRDMGSEITKLLERENIDL
jgi:hypothetical protein